MELVRWNGDGDGNGNGDGDISFVRLTGGGKSVFNISNLDFVSITGAAAAVAARGAGELVGRGTNVSHTLNIDPFAPAAIIK